jgi:Phospholipase D-like domain at C-terminus of MIT
MIIFEGNCSTNITKQSKYTIKHHNGHYVVSVMIETPDGIRMYPATRDHEQLVAMINAIKEEVAGIKGGAFYINEHGQVIVPAGNPVKYYYAGEYHERIRLKMEDTGEEFSGRPHDEHENLLSPGQPWDGRPRPGIQYTLAAGGTDIHYKRELGPQREQIVKLSKVVGVEAARRTASKIARVKGNKGGAFYVNEYRALFCPVTDADFVNYLFIGVLTKEDPWFPKWESATGGLPPQPPIPPSPEKPRPDGVKPPTPSSGEAEIPSARIQETPLPSPIRLEPLEGNPDENDDDEDEEFAAPGFEPVEKELDIADGQSGHSYDSLFAPYLQGATEVVVEDTYMLDPHQVANFLRFCELLIRQGSVKRIKLITKVTSDDSIARLETVKRSVGLYGIPVEVVISDRMHDRRITTDTGWKINLGRGLDIYKRPDGWISVGASDFALRPCHQTTIIFHRFGQEQRKQA